MGVKTDIKRLVLDSNTTITNLAKLMSEKTGKHYSQPNISQKLLRGTLKYDEAKLIGDVLGYELKFIKKSF